MTVSAVAVCRRCGHSPAGCECLGGGDYTASATVTPITAAGRIPGSTWRPVDLSRVLSGDYRPPEPTVGARSDGVGLFYPGRTHTVSAESEGGKTWLALIACLTEMERGHSVVYLDFEDDEGGIVSRLLLLGASPGLVRDQFIYVRPEEPVTDGEGWACLEELLVGARPSLAILDGVTEAMGLHGLNPLDNQEVARFGRVLPGAIAARGPAVASLDHVTKSSEGRGRYALGAVHKLNGVTGAAYVLENRTAFGRGLVGRSTVLIAKDRPGQLRGHSRPRDGLHWFGDLVMESHAEGFNDAGVYPPTQRQQGDTGFRPTSVMARICRVLESRPGLSKNAIEVAVGGRATVVRAALEILVAEGYVVAEKKGRGFCHSLVREFDVAEAA